MQQQLFANTKIIKQHHQLAKKLDIRMPFQPAPSVQQSSVQRAFTQPTSSGSLNSVPASQPLQPSHPLELMSQWYYTDPQGDVQGGSNEEICMVISCMQLWAWFWLKVPDYRGLIGMFLCYPNGSLTVRHVLTCTYLVRCGIASCCVGRGCCLSHFKCFGK